jgi:hypothetical protein
MGGFVAVVPLRNHPAAAAPLFNAALAAQQRLVRQVPNAAVDNAWARAASFPRRNGSGATVTRDDAAGAWLIAMGTWFHGDGYGSGHESRLLHRYRQVGALALGRELEGFFCLVIGDASTREVIVITDIVGSCHAFLSVRDDAVVLSNSSLALGSVCGVELDAVGCQEFLATGVVFEDRTCFSRVRKIGPARVLRIGADGVAGEERYWDVRDIAGDAPLGPDTAVTQLWETLTHAARRVGTSFQRPVCDLTGGYDSRAALAAFVGAGVEVAVTVSGAPDSRDVVVSKGLAQQLGLKHVYLEGHVSDSLDRMPAALELTDGEYDVLDYARILGVHEQLRASFDGSINGSFGEVARGYWWELLFPHIGERRPLNGQALARARFASAGHDLGLVREHLRVDLCEHFAGVIGRANDGLATAPNTLQMDNAYLSLRMQRWQGRIASSTDRLWPCVSPFMFRSVLETMLKTSPRQRLRSLLIRQMLSRFQPAIAAYPMEHGYPAVPATWRNIVRFRPVLSHYASRVRSKLARMTGVGQVVANTAGPPLRSLLWQREDVRQLLDPGSMKASALIDADRARDFLARSRGEQFAHDVQWSRLLSLESALRAAHAVHAANRE